MNTVHDLVTSRTFNRWLPRIAALVLAAGVITFLTVKYWNTADSVDTPISTLPATKPKPEPVSVAMSPAARQVASKFIHTAVARKNLAEAWKITGPSLRSGITFKEWMTGNIPVVPYPASEQAALSVRYSHKNRVELEWGLTARKGLKMKPQSFLMDLVRIGKTGHKHWVVDYWTPLSVPQLPAGPGG
jgi:hypothetical protein